MSATAPTLQSLGIIRADEVYPLPLFQRMAGMNSWAMRKARAKGLLVRRVGKRGFIRGQDWFEFLGREHQ